MNGDNRVDRKNKYRRLGTHSKLNLVWRIGILWVPNVVFVLGL